MSAENAEDEADIVIVGGGTAGCVLASRLSENPERRVLLLEAGRDFGTLEPDDIRDVFPRSYANPDYFYRGIRASISSVDDVRQFDQARILGGGSSVMGMWALRGLAADFDGWSQSGATGWSYRDLLPCFRRLERDHDFDGKRHGQEGPIGVRRVPPELWPPFAKAMSRAARARGFAEGADMNASDEDGFFPLPISADAQGRASATRYLDATVRARPNLRIRSDIHVERVVFDGDRNATGVEARTAGRRIVIGARAVVLSAGAISSPVLLLRSGIGPSDELAASGIDLVHHLPKVGQDLQNHAFLHFAGFVRLGQRQPAGLLNYVTSCLRFSSGAPGAPPSDMMLSFISRPGIHAGGNAVGMVGVHLYAPASRGRVGIVMRGDDVSPVVDFRLLSDPLDQERLSSALRLAAGLMKDCEDLGVVRNTFLVPPEAPIRAFNAPELSAHFRTAGLGLLASMPRTLQRHVLRSVVRSAVFLDEMRDETWDDHARAAALPMFHVAGTCGIGRVVNSDLSVRGVQRLFVVDASVMPSVTRSNTFLPTVAIAERGAEIIK